MLNLFQHLHFEEIPKQVRHECLPLLNDKRLLLTTIYSSLETFFGTSIILEYEEGNKESKKAKLIYGK